MKPVSRRFALLVLCGALALHGGTVAFAATAQGVISYMEGQVTIDNVAAAIGDPVPLGSTIRTDSASECLIVFRDKNILHLNEKTVFVFNPGNLQTGSELRQGAVGFVLKNLENVGGAPGFLIRTPSAVAGVRGTSGFIMVEDPNTTYLCLCNGALHLVDSLGGNARDIEAAHHKELRFTRSGDTVTVTDAPLQYHTDDDMQDLAARIGVNIDWNTVDH
jgi:hypothetical protein